MDLLPVENGEIKIRPLAFESLGVRGMATYLETDDIEMIIDPGSALGPRFRLDPHEREYVALYKSREEILSAAKKANILSISHYHFDHFVPNFENWKFIWSSPEVAEQLYTDKIILAKDITDKINTSQRKRGYLFRKKNHDLAEEIRSADGKEFEFNATKLKFSKPFYHGEKNTKLGFCLILAVKTSNSTLIHASDVQGPMQKETLKYIISQKPDLLIIGGPPIYLSFKLEERNLENAQKNLIKLAENIPKVVVDHHLLRSLKYKEFLEPIEKKAADSNNEILTASKLMGKEPNLLEARRKELYKKEPTEKEWHEKVEEGDFKEGF